MSELEAILKYNMPELHAKAYKICLMWEKQVEQEFPGYQTTKLPKKGDPRKGSLFQYCLKLVTETNGIIPDDEYKLWVMAQLHILKSLGNEKRMPLIGPQCLAGKPAWRRWQIWKRKYDQHNNFAQAHEANVQADEEKVIVALKKTKEFLVKQYEGLPTEEQIKTNLKDGTISRWLSLGKISPYYVLLNPHIGKDFIDKLKIDLSIYEKDINNNIKYFYKNEL